VKEGGVGRAELAGGSASKSPAGLAARKKLAFGTLAAPSRELTERCKLGTRLRAVGGRSHLWGQRVVKFASLEYAQAWWKATDF